MRLPGRYTATDSTKPGAKPGKNFLGPVLDRHGVANIL